MEMKNNDINPMGAENLISNCPLCEEHSLHVFGGDEVMQCINCGFVSSEAFKVPVDERDDNKEWKRLNKQMKKWSKDTGERFWIPTMMTLPFGALYPLDVEVDGEDVMKWGFAKMTKIPAGERKNHQVPGKENKFYESKYDTDNAKIYDTFLEAMQFLNKASELAVKQMKEDGEELPQPEDVVLPKLKKVK